MTKSRPLLLPLYFSFVCMALMAAMNTVASELNRPRVGLVLGGGSARGLAHIGVLKVLEEARIPIDCVVGSSMGALVGGGLAAGRTAAEIEVFALNNDWADILSGSISRDKLAYRQKRNDRLGLAQFEVGVSDQGQILFPPSVISTQKIALFLRKATLGVAPPHFDRLTIPYRAVAANIEDGSAVVLEQGDLVTAMSASMAIPGIFPAVKRQGEVLVDGGIANNLPVDVARHSCADVVIAVNVGWGLLRKDKIDGVLTMADQLIRILMAKNVQPQLKSLTERDILIEPELTDLGSTEFTRVKEFIQKGEEAARAKLASLQRYAVSEAEYQAWQTARSKKRDNAPVIDEVTITVEPGSRVNPNVLKERLDVKPGDTLHTEELAVKLENAYAATDLSQLGYEVLRTHKGTQLNVLPVEKSWGPNYLSFGLGLRTDLNRDSDFTLSALYRRTWVNALGAEWKTLLQFGEVRQLYSEFYQPLVEDAWLYVAPYVSLYSKAFNKHTEDGKFTKLYAHRTSLGVDVGSSVSRFGELRAGLSVNRYQDSSDSLRREFIQSSTSYDWGAQANLYYDQLDKLYFPSSGSAFHLSGYRSLGGFGSRGINYTKGSLRAATALQMGKWRTLWSVDASYASEDAPLSEYALLGGLFNLSGYPYKSLLGRGKTLAKVQFYYPVGFIHALSDRANYIGVSLEMGHVFDRIATYKTKPGSYSYALYWATDTVLGPFYMAYARGDTGQNRFYIVLGADF